MVASASDVCPTLGSPSTRPVFPTNTPRCAKASRNSAAAPPERINYPGCMSQTQCLAEKVIRSGLLDDGANETSVGGWGWEFRVGFVVEDVGLWGWDWKLARWSESRFVITSWRGGLKHLGWLLVSLSTPVIPLLVLPDPPCLAGARQTLRSIFRISLRHSENALLLTSMFVGMRWVGTYTSAFPSRLYLTVLRLSHSVTHIWGGMLRTQRIIHKLSETSLGVNSSV